MIDVPILVFGSNRRGAHGRGAAAFAKRYAGAVPGQGEGLQGHSYAIPTKDAQLATLPLSEVADGIARFCAFASDHPDRRFDVTRIGCGLAGFDDNEIAPLFRDAPTNCMLPYVWQIRRDLSLPPRIIVAGSRSISDRETMFRHLDCILSGLKTAQPAKLTIVSGTARGPDRAGEAYAKDNRLQVLRFPADWDRYGRGAGAIRNQRMAWASSHLIVFWDGLSRGAHHMIRTAQNDRLQVCIVRM